MQFNTGIDSSYLLIFSLVFAFATIAQFEIFKQKSNDMKPTQPTPSANDKSGNKVKKEPPKKQAKQNNKKNAKSPKLMEFNPETQPDSPIKKKQPDTLVSQPKSTNNNNNNNNSNNNYNNEVFQQQNTQPKSEQIPINNINNSNNNMNNNQYQNNEQYQQQYQQPEMQQMQWQQPQFYQQQQQYAQQSQEGQVQRVQQDMQMEEAEQDSMVMNEFAPKDIGEQDNKISQEIIDNINRNYNHSVKGFHAPKRDKHHTDKSHTNHKDERDTKDKEGNRDGVKDKDTRHASELEVVEDEAETESKDRSFQQEKLSELENDSYFQELTMRKKDVQVNTKLQQHILDKALKYSHQPEKMCETIKQQGQASDSAFILYFFDELYKINNVQAIQDVVKSNFDWVTKNKEVQMHKEDRQKGELLDPKIFTKAIQLMATSSEYSLKLSELKDMMVQFAYAEFHFTYAYNQLINMNSKKKAIYTLWGLWSEMAQLKVPRNKYTQRQMIFGLKKQVTYIKLDDLERCELLFNEIQNSNQRGILMSDDSLLNIIMQGCMKLKNHSRALENQKAFASSGCQIGKSIHSLLISLYSESGNFDKAWEVFIRNNNKRRSYKIYTTMIESSIKNKNQDSLYQIIEQAIKDDYKFDGYIQTCIIKSFVAIEDPDKAMHYQQQWVLKDRPSLISFNVLLNASIKADNLRLVTQFFKEMRQHRIEPDIVTQSILIKCFCKNQLIELALQLFSTFKLKFKPDEILQDTILDGIVRASNVRKYVKQVDHLLREMVEVGTFPSSVTFSILVKIYSKAKEQAKALSMEEEMKKQNVKPGLVNYTCIIQTCIHIKDIDKALEKFNSMILAEVLPDALTYETLIRGCLDNKQFQNVLNLISHSLNHGIRLKKETQANVVKVLLNNNQKMFVDSLFKMFKQYNINMHQDLKVEQISKLMRDN